MARRKPTNQQGIALRSAVRQAQRSGNKQAIAAANKAYSDFKTQGAAARKAQRSGGAAAAGQAGLDYSDPNAVIAAQQAEVS